MTTQTINTTHKLVTYSKLPGELFEVIGDSQGKGIPAGLVCLRFIDEPLVAVWADPKELCEVYPDFGGLDLVI